jgi:hypothetical protein
VGNKGRRHSSVVRTPTYWAVTLHWQAFFAHEKDELGGGHYLKGKDSSRLIFCFVLFFAKPVGLFLCVILDYQIDFRAFKGSTTTFLILKHIYQQYMWFYRTYILCDMDQAIQQMRWLVLLKLTFGSTCWGLLAHWLIQESLVGKCLNWTSWLPFSKWQLVTMNQGFIVKTTLIFDGRGVNSNMPLFREPAASSQGQGNRKNSRR